MPQNTPLWGMFCGVNMQVGPADCVSQPLDLQQAITSL